TFSWSSFVQSAFPDVIASRASFTQMGHSESVSRGHPSTGFVFCQDFKSGFSVHFGVNVGFGLKRLKYCTTSKALPALKQTAASTYFIMRLLNFALPWVRAV